MRLSPTATIILSVVVIASCRHHDRPTARSQQTSEGVRGLGPDESPNARTLDATYDLAHGVFNRAIYYKPSEAALADHPDDLPPLILQQAAAETTDAPQQHFGRLTARPDGRIAVDTTRPTVYISDGLATLHGRDYRQRLHIWWYPRKADANDARPAWYGIRTTLNAEGAPIIWEAISNTDPIARIFVMKSLADAAADAFGPPLPGRRHAVEPALDEHPNVVVPRVLADGPVPMGPWAYLRAPDHVAAALICRCMPSQLSDIESIIDTREFDLVPLSRLSMLTPRSAGRLPGLPTRPDELDFAVPEMADANWLERALRLPPGF